jgi:hypothetical protein
MRLNHIIGTLGATSLLLTSFASYGAPVSGYMEGWDAPGDTAGWGSNTIVSTVVHANAGGNPDGHIQTRGNGHDSFDVGALSSLPAVTGNFGGSIWSVSVDLAFLTGPFDDAWLRFRYQDASENGWNYSLTNNFSQDWNTLSVTFDSSWDDVTATANGWLPDNLSVDPVALPSESWATTMSNVFTTEVRISGEGDMLAGIDNFKLKQVPVPAGIWLFGSSIIGLVGLARRKTV